MSSPWDDDFEGCGMAKHASFVRPKWPTNRLGRDNRMKTLMYFGLLGYALFACATGCKKSTSAKQSTEKGEFGPISWSMTAADVEKLKLPQFKCHYFEAPLRLSSSSYQCCADAVSCVDVALKPEKATPVELVPGIKGAVVVQTEYFEGEKSNRDRVKKEAKIDKITISSISSGERANKMWQEETARVLKKTYGPPSDTDKFKDGDVIQTWKFPGMEMELSAGLLNITKKQ